MTNVDKVVDRAAALIDEAANDTRYAARLLIEEGADDCLRAEVLESQRLSWEEHRAPVLEQVREQIEAFMRGDQPPTFH